MANGEPQTSVPTVDSVWWFFWAEDRIQKSEIRSPNSTRLPRGRAQRRQRGRRVHRSLGEEGFGCALRYVESSLNFVPSVPLWWNSPLDLMIVDDQTIDRNDSVVP